MYQPVRNLVCTKCAEIELLPKKASKAQKKREKEEHERQIREQELARVNKSGSQPESAEDFERLVMGEPNSSMLWIQYMAFLISLVETEKARGIAERGLATINYRQAHVFMADFCRQLRTCKQARPLHLEVCNTTPAARLGMSIWSFISVVTIPGSTNIIMLFTIAQNIVVAAGGVSISAFTVFFSVLPVVYLSLVLL